MKWLAVVSVAAALVAADLATEDLIIMNAEARVGRPATPGSVAGVARRTTRRMVRRTSIYVATLPAGCQTVNVEGTTLQQCGGTYYQASGSQYEVVEVE
jgi:hypothetical protein